MKHTRFNVSMVMAPCGAAKQSTGPTIQEQLHISALLNDTGTGGARDRTIEPVINGGPAHCFLNFFKMSFSAAASASLRQKKNEKEKRMRSDISDLGRIMQSIGSCHEIRK